MTMHDPLAELGPMALRELLVGDVAEAHERLRHLNLSELVGLAEAADLLARMARYYVNKVCGVCMMPIVWWRNPPIGMVAGWRHVGQAGPYPPHEHRAVPAHDTTSCPVDLDRPAVGA